MKLLLRSAALLLALLPVPGLIAADASPSVTTYQVRQTVTLSDIPAGTAKVEWWISVPDDQRHQDVLDIDVVSAPGTWRMVQEPDHGNRFLLLEVPAPSVDTLTAVIEFTLRRESTFTAIDPDQAGAITDSHRRAFAEDLRLDSLHMQVTPEIAALAAAAVAGETNVARQTRRLLDAVADHADHYGKNPSKSRHSEGDATVCLVNGGGTCTDLHSLFIAMARSRGIPARLQMGYRLLERNRDKAVDPGYRCWAEYFLPGYGWVSTDIVEADADDGLGRDRWFAGLTDRRLWLHAGRDFPLPGAGRVNIMPIGYALIDGIPARVLPSGDLPAQLSRQVWFTEAD